MQNFFLADFEDLRNPSYSRVNFSRNELWARGPKNIHVSRPTELENQMLGLYKYVHIYRYSTIF